MSDNIMIGYSGHAYVVADAALKNELDIIGYTDVEESNENPYHLDYIGFEKSDSFDFWGKQYGFILGIGDNFRRMQAANFIKERKEKLITVVHPQSVISENVAVKKGSFIAAGAIINSNAKIGKAVIINTGTIVEHECVIADGAHIAPGAVLAGNVKVGSRSFIGANSVIKEGVEIGNDVIIGAGTVVLNNVKSKSKVVGNPGRLI